MIRRKNGYWTLEKLIEEALKYDNRGDFQKMSRSAYLISYKKGLLDQICSHMISVYKPDGYWNYENIKEEALKYNSRSSFKKNSKAYSAAIQNGYLDDVCSHMELKGSKYKRYVYKAYFSDGSIYFGLTHNFNKRISEHLNRERSSVYKYMILINENPTFEIISDLLSKEDAAIKECEYINEYIKLGFNVLNKKIGGGLGGNSIIWKFNNVKEEALKYSTKTSFQKGSNGAYSAALRYGWLDEVCSHMCILIKRWTIEIVREEAMRFKNRSSFQKGSNGAYCAAHRNGWLDDVCSHMNKIN